jgi:uncharacterized protein YgbK (DUF1537 family)
MLVILADDVTGALDAAAPFAGRGLHTRVALRPEAIAHALRGETDVLSINLNCRETTPERAAQVMAQALALLPVDARLFKKVDSRLKGNIAAELAAMSFNRALVAPAIPAFGRVVRDRHVEGFGIDQPIPVHGVLSGSHDRYLIPDTLDDPQMQQALDSAEAERIDLMIGARGLAEALARSMTGLAEARPAVIPGGHALFVIGSRDPITLAQVAVLRQDVELDFTGAPNGVVEPRAPGRQLVALVQAVQGEGNVTADEVSHHLAEGVVPQLLEAAGTWLLCGGATAEAVLTRAGITELTLKGECLPGLGVAEAGGRCIIAKSGGFGQPDTLRQIAARIMGAG